MHSGTRWRGTQHHIHHMGPQHYYTSGGRRVWHFPLALKIPLNSFRNVPFIFGEEKATTATRKMKDFKLLNRFEGLTKEEGYTTSELRMTPWVAHWLCLIPIHCQETFVELWQKKPDRYSRWWQLMNLQFHENFHILNKKWCSVGILYIDLKLGVAKINYMNGLL